jgi:intein/homing endonuclease
MVLTKEGYVMAGDLNEGDEIVKMKDVSNLPSEISEADKRFTEYEGTKKGTVIKRCEVTGDEFECVWEERELCTKTGYESDLFNMKKDVMTSSENYEYVKVKSVEFFGRENVYNGTVAVYHNYFTVDENTNTIINQMN